MRDIILLVDDEPGVLKALTRVLRETDAEIVKFTDPRQALAELKRQKVSVIISDQGLRRYQCGGRRRKRRRHKVLFQ